MPSIIQSEKLFSVSKLVAICVVSLLAILLDSIGLFTSIQNSFSAWSGNFISPSREFLEKHSFRADYFQSRRDYLKEIESLQEDLINANSKIALLSQENQELETLKKQNKFNTEFRSFPAQVIQYIPDQFGHVLINKGLEDSIREGNALVIQNFLLGIVTEVGDKNSIVRLINSPQSNIPVSGGNHNSRGLVIGDIGKGLIMKDVPVNSKIEKGELVLTTSLNSSLPEGLIIGKIDNISQEASLPTKTAELDILVDLINLHNVFVLLEP